MGMQKKYVMDDCPWCKGHGVRSAIAWGEAYERECENCGGKGRALVPNPWFGYCDTCFECVPSGMLCDRKEDCVSYQTYLKYNPDG